MKKIILGLSGIVIGIMFIVSSCTTPAIEVAQEAYDYNAIVPKVLGEIQGPTVAIQTFTSNYTIGYSRGGSTWNWSAENAVVKSVSEDTRIATIEFTNDGTANVVVTETTMGGKTSEPVSLEVTVQKYCPLANGVNDMVGSWSGDDAWYESIITTEVDGSDMAVSGISVGFMEDWWGEEVTEGGTITMKVNEDGTVEIPRQYIYTTVYEGDPYEYDIKGSGTWDNCGDSPVLLIKYDIYYRNEADDFMDGKGLAEYYSPSNLPTPYMTADILLDNNKSARIFEQKIFEKPNRK